MNLMRIIRYPKKFAKQCKQYHVSFLRGAYWRMKGYIPKEVLNYNLKRKNYKNYLSTRESMYPCYANGFKEISNNKLIFGEIFGKYINVAENYAIISRGKIFPLNNNNISNENFYEWLTNKSVIVKICDGREGENIFLVDGKENGVFVNGVIYDKKKFDDFILGLDEFLIQSKVKQGEFENNLFEKTVNTIRICTVRGEGEVGHKIVAAVQRIGSDKSFPADNFSQGAYCAEIDIETGVLGRVTSLYSIDEKGNHIYYTTHPDTGRQITGLKIPHWERVKERLVEITRALPLWEFVAWDVVVGDDDISLIEMNMKSSLTVFQVFGPMRDTLLGQVLLSFKD